MKRYHRLATILLYLLGMPYDRLEVDIPEWTRPAYYHQN